MAHEIERAVVRPSLEHLSQGVDGLVEGVEEVGDVVVDFVDVEGVQAARVDGVHDGPWGVPDLVGELPGIPVRGGYGHVQVAVGGLLCHRLVVESRHRHGELVAVCGRDGAGGDRASVEGPARAGIQRGPEFHGEDRGWVVHACRGGDGGDDFLGLPDPLRVQAVEGLGGVGVDPRRLAGIHRAGEPGQERLREGRGIRVVGVEGAVGYDPSTRPALDAAPAEHVAIQWHAAGRHLVVGEEVVPVLPHMDEPELVHVS